MNYRVAELFTSINGEGIRAGKVACFIRLSGCPLACIYCDTAWARQSGQGEDMTLESIVDHVKALGVSYVTLTGGEPLAHPGVERLIEALMTLEDIYLEIESSGAVSTAFLADYRVRHDRLSLTLDYKLSGSGMSSHMKEANYRNLRSGDAVKYVISSIHELEEVSAHISLWQSHSPQAEILLSAVYGKIEASQLVDWLIENTTEPWQPQSRVQLQLHKYIWDPSKRGV